MPPTVSLCMIVKNEEANLPACLGSVRDLVQEMIIVDTGSTDRTKEVAGRFGARVFDFPWIDDFAAARNESIRHANGQWIFWLDADDRLDATNQGRLRDLMVGLPDENIAYVMAYDDGKSAIGRIPLFRNHQEIRWSYRVHEQILPAIERLGGRTVQTNVVIRTLGYYDPAAVRSKLERNLRLLLLENADRPGDALSEWNLGRTLLRLDRVAEAASWLKQCLGRSGQTQPFYQALAYGQLAEALCRLGQFREALPVCREGRAKAPEDVPLLLAEGVVLAQLGQRGDAEMRLAEVLRREPGNAMARNWLSRVRG